MKSITDLIEKRMFFLILGLLFLSLFIENDHQVGINKTIGWTWDASNWIYWLSYINFIIIIGYGLLAVKRYKSNKYFSGIHLVLILFSFLIYDLFYLSVNWIAIINSLMIVIFIVNFIISILDKRIY